MTRKEDTGIRELTMSSWIRENLPDSSTGTLVTDLDFIIYNYKTRKIMLIEVKTRNANLKTWQSMLFNDMANWIRNGIDKSWSFEGFHVIRFEKTGFHDGQAYLDDEPKTEKEIRAFLSFEPYF